MRNQHKLRFGQLLSIAALTPLFLHLAIAIAFVILTAHPAPAQEFVLEPSGEPELRESTDFEQAESEQAEPEQKELETDRDAFTPALSTVGRHTLVVESAYTFIDNSAADTHSFPELLLRYGLNDWIEMRLGWNYEIGGSNPVTGIDDGLAPLAGDTEEESKIFYGLKVQATEQQDWLPSSIFTAQLYTPTSGESTTTQFVGTYGFGWELVPGVRWDSALRYGTGGESGDRFSQWAPSTVLRAALDERWNAHLEYFALSTDGLDNELNQAFISPGMHCLVTPNLELGARIGWGVTQDAPNFFANTGVGTRF